MKQRCRFCKCPWENGWVEPDLCGVCAQFLRDLDKYVLAVRKVSRASIGRMFDETIGPFARKPRAAK